MNKKTYRKITLRKLAHGFIKGEMVVPISPFKKARKKKEAKSQQIKQKSKEDRVNERLARKRLEGASR
jgi:hypothetical protein